MISYRCPLVSNAQLSTALCVGGFLPFAIYSQTDSPQECQSNEKYHDTKLFSSQRDHQGLHIRLAANSAQAKWLLNFHLHDKIKLIAEFAAKENLKSSFPFRFKARRAEEGVDIRVECVTPDGLSGKKRVWFRGIFHLIGILGESSVCE